jgi:hypothetical protein
MQQNSGAMNSQSMVKSGDQPRMTDKNLTEVRGPANITYSRNSIKGNMTRNNGSRSMSRG